MDHSTKRSILVVSELIKRIKTSRGQIKEALLVNIRKSFEMKPDEKYVVSKLRLILIHLRANVDDFQIKAERNGKKEIDRNIESMKNRFSNGFFTMELAQNFAKATTILKPEMNKRRRRMSLEEKQMKKLKAMKFAPEDQSKDAGNLISSKLSYLKICGLVPNVVCL